MSTFVDIGWGVDGVQMLFPDVFDDEDDFSLAEDSEVLLDSKHTCHRNHDINTDKGAHP